LECERIAFARSKDSFWSVKGKLSEAKTGIFRTILFRFRPINKCPKIYKRQFPLIINDLAKCLITRVFETEVGVGGFQMLIFDTIVKIFPKNKKADFSSVRDAQKGGLCHRRTTHYDLHSFF
jgi:hypothetical protein